MKRVIYSSALIVFALVGALFALEEHQIVNKKPDSLRIAFFNLNFENKRTQVNTELLISSQADVVFISEWTGQGLSIPKLLSNGYSLALNIPKNGTHGYLLLRRLNVSISSELTPSPIKSPCRIPFLTSKIIYQGRAFNLIGVHAPPPIPSCKGSNEATLEFINNLFSNKRINRAFGVTEQGLPTLMMGDFNSLPFSAEMKRLRANLVDASNIEGAFLGLTWSPSKYMPRIARIDYAYLTDDIEVTYFGNIRSYTSDHNFMVVDIKVPGMYGPRLIGGRGT